MSRSFVEEFKLLKKWYLHVNKKVEWKGGKKGEEMKEGWESGGKAKIFHVYFVYGIHGDERELGLADYN